MAGSCQRNRAVQSAFPFTAPPAEEDDEGSESGGEAEQNESPNGVEHDKYGTAPADSEAAMEVDENSATSSRRAAAADLISRDSFQFHSVNWWYWEYRRCGHEVTGLIRTAQVTPLAETFPEQQLQNQACHRYSTTLARVKHNISEPAVEINLTGDSPDFYNFVFDNGKGTLAGAAEKFNA